MSEFILIFLMTLVTFIPRYLPLALASKIRLHKTIMQALPYVPIAVLTIIVTQTIFVVDGRITSDLVSPYLWASIAALVAALVQRHLYITILVGLLTYTGLKMFL